jgi:hypothetical protein
VDLVKVQQQAVVGHHPHIRNGRTLAMLHQIYSQQGVAGELPSHLPAAAPASSSFSLTILPYVRPLSRGGAHCAAGGAADGHSARHLR